MGQSLMLFAICVFFMVFYFYKTYQYWSKKGVYTIKPTFPLGNLNTLFPKGFSIGNLSREFYNELKSKGHKFGGVYLVTEPHLVLADPEYVKDIMAKDFQFFVNRGFYYDCENDPLSGHLFALDGDDWRNIRIKLTPTFTSGKMKMMFKLIMDCTNKIIKAIEKNVEDVDIKDIMSRFTMDVIGSCALGIECNNIDNPNNEFNKMQHKIFECNFWDSVQYFILLNFPKLAHKLRLRTNRKDVEDFFIDVIRETVRTREEHGVTRKDFLQLLIELKRTDDLTINEIAAQAFLFFVAGFESSSTTMTFALYELARNPDIQEKVRKEIKEVCKKHDGEFTYQALQEMKYLTQVLEESLRLYTPIATLTRKCIKKYKLRNTNIEIDEGTKVLIPSLGLHMDPEFYPNPEIFDPERFSEQNKKLRPGFVHLPFGDGPRNCIGLRFGMMQSKIGVAKVIENFEVTISPITKPLRFDPYVFLLNTMDPVFLRAKPIENN